MVKIIPAILSNSPSEVEELLRQADGVVDRVQIDIIDGQFVQNKTIDPAVLENFDTDLLLDFHLMTKEPVDWVERCVRAQADRIIGQIEQMSSQVDFVGKVSEIGLSVGLAIDLDTKVSALDPTILNNLDVVLVMAVSAGFGGQKFEAKVLDKIKELDEIRVRDENPFKICVDGGETPDTMDDTRIAGADEIIVGRRIFAGDLAENIDKYIKAAYKK